MLVALLTHSCISYALKVFDLREDAWGLQKDFGQQQLDPTDYRYRYATATLARIVATFVSIFKAASRIRSSAKEREGKEFTIFGGRSTEA